MSNSPQLTALQAVLEAARFAAEKHTAQRRKGETAEPYINHLLEVADLVAHALAEPDTNVVIAALLHDTIEDVGVTKEQIEARFGSDVAGLVAEVTDDKTLMRAERKRLQILHAPTTSVRAQVVKVADKISNLRSILNSPPVDWSLERRQEYVAWARQVVDAIPAPNPILKAEFDAVYRKWQDLQGRQHQSI